MKPDLSNTEPGSYQPAGSCYRRWQQLNDWLLKHEPIWRCAPFMEPCPAWIPNYPGLAQMVTALTDAECDELEEAPEKLAGKLSPSLPELAWYGEMTRVRTLSAGSAEIRAVALPEVRAMGMPGRKREQAGAFAAALRPLQHPILDWCCGKGHLSRTLTAQSRKRVDGYEYNPELTAGGNRLATRFGDAVQIHCQDVMAPDLPMPEGAHGVALHACGDLHRRLLQRGTTAALPRLSFSPCCYHLTADRLYQTLAKRTAAYENRLVPERSDLRLAVRETVTAPARVRQQTQTLSQWRLGFDGLQRHLRGVDQYLPVPSYPPGRIRDGFPAFCRWAAEKKQLHLPVPTDFDHWLSYGVQRNADVRRYELVRHLFRRPLELWVVLDYAVFLEEQGYRVQLGQFCTRSLTPRNLLLDAVRVCGTPRDQHSRL